MTNDADPGQDIGDPVADVRGGERASAALRAATAPDHQSVDAAYGRFALGTREGYRSFLIAHARILPLAERLLRPAELVPGWTGRTSALLSDLDDLGAPPPAELAFEPQPGEAARWGAIYVVEGSRLGGAFLAKSVPLELPSAYLSARHVSGGWRKFLAALDTALTGPEQIAEAATGAHAMFGAYGAAAFG
jgi:heme oxygenase